MGENGLHVPREVEETSATRNTFGKDPKDDLIKLSLTINPTFYISFYIII